MTNDVYAKQILKTPPPPLNSSIQKSSAFTFNFYNVEHGSCTHIITPNNKNILVDIGSSENLNVANHLKNTLKTQQIDLLIITHPHLDHIRGFPDLKKYGLMPKTLLLDKRAFPLSKKDVRIENDIAIIDFMNDVNKDYSTTVAWDCSLINPSCNGGVSVSIFNSPDCKQDDLNTYSSLYVFEYAQKKVVLTGDNNKEILQKMTLNNREFAARIANADFLLAPHHGRDTDFCAEFFDKVDPALTIISDCYKKHSSQENTTDNYSGKGMSIGGKMRHTLTTRNDGSIELTISHDGGVKVKKFTCKTHIVKEAL
jgi:competence protein ComEC